MSTFIKIFLFLIILVGCQPINRKNTNNIEDNRDLKVKFNAFDTIITVTLLDTKEISSCQNANYLGFVNKQDSLVSQILDTIFTYYKTYYSDYRVGWTLNHKWKESELEKYLPIPTNAKNLKHFITPSTIYIRNPQNCLEGSFSILFDCTWDVEHGIGVIIKNWKVSEARLGPDLFIF